MEQTTPAFATQVTTLRLTVYADWLLSEDDNPNAAEELASAFFDAIRPEVEAFSLRHHDLIVVVTP